MPSNGTYNISFTTSLVSSATQPDPEPAVYETTEVSDSQLQTIVDFFDNLSSFAVDNQGPTYVYDQVKLKADQALSDDGHAGWTAIINNSIPVGPTWVIRDGHIHPLLNGKLAHSKVGSDHFQGAIKVNFDHS